MSDDRSGAEWPIDRRKDRIDTSARPVEDGPRQERVEEPRTTRETRVETSRRGLNPIFIALGGLVLLGLLLWLFVARGSSDQDKLTTGTAAQKTAANDPEKLCGSNATYDLLKRELFHRAAQLRGSDQAVFDRLSAYAAVRLDNPVMESNDDSTKRVSCSGSLSLDLPPGLAVAGGRTTLSSDIDYSVQPAADGSGNALTLRNADAIITPLATLSRTAAPAAPASTTPESAPTAPTSPAPEPQPLPPAAPPAQVERPTPPQPPRAPASSSVRPAFDCSRATVPNERTVCSDPRLASLDRQMSVQYRSALSDADPQTRALLVQTGRRFIAYRNRCGSTSCIVDAYNGRMREVRDILAGRWRP